MRWPALALAAGLALGAQSLAAQDEPVPQAVLDTPADDLSCAMVMAALLNRLGENGSEADKSGITIGLVYFIGRWEGASPGVSLTTAMVEHYPKFVTENYAELAQTCSRRVEGLGLRMEAAGAAVTAIEDKRQIDPHTD